MSVCAYTSKITGIVCQPCSADAHVLYHHDNPGSQVPPQRILVVYDDLDLDAGAVRFRMKGGHGGHNGMRSIIARLGNTHVFPRIRIGIGRPSGQQPVARYVLEPFSKAQREEVDVAVHEAVAVVRTVLQVGVEKAASGVRV